MCSLSVLQYTVQEIGTETVHHGYSEDSFVWQRRVITIEDQVKIRPLRKLTFGWKIMWLKLAIAGKNHAVDRVID